MDQIITNENVVSKTVQNEEILLHLETGVYFGLNPVGTFLWEKIKSGVSVTGLEQALAENYGVDVEVAKKDVEDLLTDLRNHKIIQ